MGGSFFAAGLGVRLTRSPRRLASPSAIFFRVINRYLALFGRRSGDAKQASGLIGPSPRKQLYFESPKRRLRPREGSTRRHWQMMSEIGSWIKLETPM